MTGKSPQNEIKPEQPKFDIPELFRIFNDFGHGGFLGIKLSEYGRGWAEFSMDWREDLVIDTKSGIVASSAIISMLDHASGFSCWLKRRHYKPIVTVDLRVDYLRPATPNAPIYGRAECHYMDERLNFVRGIAHNGDPEQPIAHTHGTFLTTPMRKKTPA